MKAGTLIRRCFWTVVLVPALALGQVGTDQQPAVAMGAGRMVRGTITAVAPDHLTVKTERGEVFQVAVTPNTQVRKGRDPIKYADVHVGDGVGAMGEVDRPNKTVHAMFVTVVDAEQIKKAKEAMGKSYIAGKVTAIDEVKLTILRADGVTQVIQVDEDTSFKRGGRGMQMMMGDGGLGAGSGGGRRGQGAAGGAGAAPGGDGESITLGDVKVGDMVGGPGALKGGVFVPTELRVGEPGARRGGRRQGEDGAAAAGGAAKPAPETK
ncbi:DUF5666 domain-containing protein [Granulicella tundricola]|uniref:DUF5666 domain-containing protein n=1 Tax=Granulicella tundricola (strain ATCC BAA-1859 / DSM 23138 / MP5ACTX9) TaxID=1198114 RepID=E8X120_GRATM|nr:DUF5666 domain-containing protein [Granulicella tundricola]ADW67886.1 hypothetical protein AciX9_0818 [Granulicella tundricola MP5ACTX9]